MIDKKSLTERDICTKFITPFVMQKITVAVWLLMNEQKSF